MNEEIKARLSHALEHAERRGSALESHVSVLKSDVLALLADGGKGEAVAERCARFAELYRDEHAIGKSAEEACNEIAEACRSYAAPQAECAPREAQPDGWKLVPVEPTQEMVIRANEVEFCEEGITVGQLRAAILAAPTPERADADNLSNRMYEAAKKWGVNKSCDQKLDFVDGYEAACRDLANHTRADADTAGAGDDDEFEPDQTPESDRAARNATTQFMLIRCVQLWRAKQDMKDHMMWVFNWLREQGISGKALGDSKVKLFNAAGASERADAEKDAALTDEQIRAVADQHLHWGKVTYVNANLNSIVAFARAILAAKEKK